MKIKLILYSLLFSFHLHAQVKIAKNDATPAHPSAELEVKSNNKGMLMPRLEPSNVASPTAGLMLYNTGQNKINVHNGSGWTSLGAGGLYDRFPNSIGYNGIVKSTTPKNTTFSFTVPSGITQVWIEAWAGGNSGNVIADNSTAGTTFVGVVGGDAGDFGSFLLDVVPGETISLEVGSGGQGSTSLVSGGDTRILYTSNSIAKIFTVGHQRSGMGYTENNVQNSAIPGLIMYVAGADGQRSVVSYQQSASTEFRRVSTGGKGGDAYPGQVGGQGITVSYNMTNNAEMMENLIAASGGTGAFPGAGGGVGFGNSGSGAAGLVIIHW